MKVLIALALTIVSGSAIAKWEEVTSNDLATFYAEPSSIRRNGAMVKMWGLMDLNKPEIPRPPGVGKAFLSSKTQHEYDCKEERARILGFTRFDGNMGNGSAVESVYGVAGEWEPVMPESILEDLWKIACKKRR